MRQGGPFPSSTASEALLGCHLAVASDPDAFNAVHLMVALTKNPRVAVHRFTR